MSDRIGEAFARAESDGRIALMPFLAAGHPSLRVTGDLLEQLPGAGADLIELGIPFSDPIADGPVIQAAFSEALARGVKLDDVLGLLADRRAKVKAAVLAMVSFSVVYRRGVERFFSDAAGAGFDGVIMPDLPPPEAQRVCEKAWSRGLRTVLLVAPTTSAERRRVIGELSNGFVYYMSVSGITGERKSLPAELAAGVAGMKQLTQRPVCVGFGIGSAEHVRSLRGVADGAIVGSALVRRLTGCGGEDEAVAAGVRFCLELSAGCGG